MAKPEAPYDGTTLGFATRVVEGWKQAHQLRYLSPEVSSDLAERIERAMLWARDGAD